MAAVLTYIILLLLSPVCLAESAQINPVGKVLQLLTDLEAKISAEGVAEEKAYQEFVDWCDAASTDTGFAIKTATKEKEELEATIAKTTADGEDADTKIESLGGSIAASEGDLKAASQIREKEHADFTESEAELVDAVDTLTRAIAVLERELQKNPALLQKQVNTQNVRNMIQTMSVIIDAAAISGGDRNKLLTLVQDHSSDEEQDADSDLGAPAAAAYKSHSGNIIDILEDMKEKAEEQLADARKAEMNAKHNFDLLKQSLEDQMAADSKDMSEAKTAKASAAEAKATAEGDLALTEKDLATAKVSLEMITGDCQTAAEDHETSTKSRAEELKALAEAKGIISSSTAGAEEQTYSLLQISGLSSDHDASSYRVSVGRSKVHTEVDLVNLELVAMVKRLAREQHSSALAQLASRISAVVRYGTVGGEDPFAKVKELITELIAKLEAEAGSEATHKAYCDDEMKKTAEKKDELSSDIAKLTSKIDKAAATSAKLKEQVADKQRFLANLAKTQAEMDEARKDEHTAFVKAKSELEQGIAGIQQALTILREYYGATSSLIQVSKPRAVFLQKRQVPDEPDNAIVPEAPTVHSAAEGAGTSVIAILEVIQSDFSKNLAQDTVAEDVAQSQYDKMTQENKINKAMAEQDIKYNTAEATGLDKAISEHTSDRQGLHTELSAVLEYGDKLVEMCVAKPEQYEERKARREAEIAGLKEALKYLEAESGDSFVQQHSNGKGKGLRLTRAH